MAAAETKVVPKITLEQIDALSYDAAMKWLQANTPYYPDSAIMTSKHFMTQAYLKMGMLDPRDVPYANIFHDSEGRVPLWRMMQFMEPRNLKLSEVQAAIATLEGEELVLYYVYRFLSHLGQTEWHLMGYEDGSGVPRPNEDGVIEWGDSMIPEAKLQGLSLLVDLEIGHDRLGLPNWFYETYHNEGNGMQYPSLPDLWYRILRAPQGVVDGYHKMRFFQAWTKATDETGKNHPAGARPTVAALIAGVSDSLHAHLQRRLIQLPSYAQDYLQYVDRVLMNYRYYGVVGLRSSDLQEGDAVFSRVDGPILPTLSRKGLPTAAAMVGLIDSYLVKVPTDAIILQRLLAAAESEGQGGYPVPPWPQAIR